MWQVVVADEAQRIKNAHTAISATLKALPRQRAWALTGTPLENRPDDAMPILGFVAPGLHGPAEMVAGLRRALSVVQLRRRRAAVLPDLPPKAAFELALDLLPPARRLRHHPSRGPDVTALAGGGAAGDACAGTDPAAQADLQCLPAHRRLGQAP